MHTAFNDVLTVTELIKHETFLNFLTTKVKNTIKSTLKQKLQLNVCFWNIVRKMLPKNILDYVSIYVEKE